MQFTSEHGTAFNPPGMAPQPPHYLVILKNDPKTARWSSFYNFYEVDPGAYTRHHRIAELAAHYLNGLLPFRCVHGPEVIKSQSSQQCMTSKENQRRAELPAGHSQSVVFMDTTVRAGYLHLDSPTCYLDLQSSTEQMHMSDLAPLWKWSPIPRQKKEPIPASAEFDALEKIVITLLGPATDQKGIDALAAKVTASLPFMKRIEAQCGVGSYCQTDSMTEPYFAARPEPLIKR